MLSTYFVRVNGEHMLKIETESFSWKDETQKPNLHMLKNVNLKKGSQIYHIGKPSTQAMQQLQIWTTNEWKREGTAYWQCSHHMKHKFLFNQESILPIRPMVSQLLWSHSSLIWVHPFSTKGIT